METIPCSILLRSKRLEVAHSPSTNVGRCIEEDTADCRGCSGGVEGTFQCLRILRILTDRVHFPRFQDRQPNDTRCHTDSSWAHGET